LSALAPELPEELIAARDQLIADWYLDHKRFCSECLGDSFRKPFSILHHRIFDAINGANKRKLILAPRGIGKTTICRSLAARGILFRKKRFIVYVSNTLTVAEMQTENLKHELLASETINKTFGDIRVSDRPDELDDTFSKKAWVAFGETLVLPRGMEQQVRGLNWRGHRPDLIILDDPENAKELQNEENRFKIREWFIADLMQSVDGSANWEVIYVDTLKHEDALPIHLMKSKNRVGEPLWSFVKLEICNDKLESYAPRYRSDEDIKELYDEFEKLGKLDSFYREYRNIPLAPERASFKSEHFRYFDQATGRLWLKDGTEIPQDPNDKINIAQYEKVLLLDPAKTVTPQSDFSAITVVAIDTQRHRLFVLEVFNDRVYPDQLYDKVFELVDRHKVRVVGMEVTSLNLWIVQPFKNEMVRRNKTYIELVELKAVKKKEERIRGLIPYYRQGFVYHHPAVCQELESQLLMFPVAPYDDVADSFAYIVAMMEEGGRYFEFTAGGEEPDEDEYKQLENEFDEEGDLETEYSLCTFGDYT